MDNSTLSRLEKWFTGRSMNRGQGHRGWKDNQDKGQWKWKWKEASIGKEARTGAEERHEKEARSKREAR